MENLTCTAAETTGTQWGGFGFLVLVDACIQASACLHYGYNGLFLYLFSF